MHALPATLVLLLVTVTTTAAAQQDARWLERLPAEDRAPLDASIGYAPPDFAGHLRWVGSAPMAWGDLAGKVVIIQSWSTRSGAGRALPQRLAKLLETLPADQVVAVALHTPEGVERVDRFLERQPAPIPVVIDETGSFCDDLGIYKRPVNVVIGRNGTVRYAGLNRRGLEAAVAQLLEEAHDPAARAKPRPSGLENATFPALAGTVSNATDVRGRQGPALQVEQWVNGRPRLEGKVVMVDFWATWCGPCVRSIPHVNELAERFRRDLVVIGISDEPAGKFRAGLDRTKLTSASFAYTLALDPARRMYGALGITAIPHAIVMSSDGVVRWQGHPATLTSNVLGEIVQANQGAAPARRWTKR